MGTNVGDKIWCIECTDSGLTAEKYVVLGYDVTSCLISVAYFLEETKSYKEIIIIYSGSIICTVNNVIIVIRWCDDVLIGSILLY